MKKSILIFLPLLLSIVSCETIKLNALNTATNSAPVSCSANKSLKQFAIYYGWPSSLNSATNAWTLSLVTADLARYHSVVFGAGLEDPGHGDHANTAAIIAGLTTTKSYGYVSIGEYSTPLSIAAIEAKIDQWMAMPGVDGIFLDEFGMDYKDQSIGTDSNYRIRQKTILDYVHSKGIPAIMNAFDPDDVFTKFSGNPLTFINGDSYLYESYYLSSTTRETWSFYRNKIDKLKAAKAAFPNMIMMANTSISSSSVTNTFSQALFDTTVTAAIIDGMDSISSTEDNYSASSSNMPFRTMPSIATSYCVNAAATLDNTAQTLNFEITNTPYEIHYNDSGDPSL